MLDIGVDGGVGWIHADLDCVVDTSAASQRVHCVQIEYLPLYGYENP
jgi:hypothetical protein